MDFFYRGRHRTPTPTARRAAALTAAGAVIGAPLLVPAVAHADPEWGPIIACESGGDPSAQNPSSTASGLYQFLDSTWASLGGTAYGSSAKDASPAEQTLIANKAYGQSGFSPWAASKSCWQGKSAPAPHTAPKPVHVHHRAAPKPVHRAAPQAAPAPVHRVAPKPSWAAAAYVVRGGDTLSKIAASRGGDWHALYARNRAVIGSNPDLIFPGQRLS